MDVIDRINERLAIIGKNGAEMSRELGLSNSIYSQWNTRKTKPSKKTINLLASYLDTTPEYLLTGIEKSPQLLSVDFGHGEIKKPALNEDELNSEILKRLVQLTPEETALVDAYVQGILAAREGKSSPDK